MTIVRVVVLAVIIALALVRPGSAASRYDPRFRFNTFSTPRFDIHYHQGEEAQARRLAVLAEEVATKLDATLGRASGRVHVILVDQSDLPNGWATPLPYNVIEMTLASPSGESMIGNTDDWLRLVFTHEYTHVVHLSRGGGWMGALRKVFGRHPLLYPNVFLPVWQIEGLATFEESALTGEGRVHAGDFRIIVQNAAANARFLPLDRVNGGLLDWPSGHAPYVYGAYFHEFLAKRYGDAPLRRLVEATSRRPPYFGAGAFKTVFGKSVGDLWAEYRADVARDAAVPATTATRLTHHGFNTVGPRFGPDGLIYYSAVNPHGFPALMAVSPEGGRPRSITNRYLGNRIGFAGTTLVFDEIQTVRNVGLQSDLHAMDLRSGERWQLTRHARGADPDVSPDGKTIVCTVQQEGRRDLATIALSEPGSLQSPIQLTAAPDTHYASPRWSPDGRWIAAERIRWNRPAEIVVINVQTGEHIVRSAIGGGRSVSPAWMPDGSLLFASDREGGAFQIYRLDVRLGTMSRLDGVGPTAQSPDVSKDGKTLVLVGYTDEGYDLFSVPLDSARWTPVDHRHVLRVEPRPRMDAAWRSVTVQEAGGVKVELRAMDPESPSSERPTSAQEIALQTRRYSPWRSLAPRYWTPIVESDNDELVLGAATGSWDALARHAYGVQAGWTLRGRPDWQVAYAYDRWWPTLFLDAADDTDPFRDGTIRTTEVNAGVLLPLRRVRSSQSFLASFHGATDLLQCSGCGPRDELRAARRAVRGGWLLDSARSYGYSISDEDGWHAVVTTELTREAFGADGNAGAAILDLRGFLPVIPRHGVLAGRFAGATAWGDASVRRVFTASGNGPQTAGFGFDFDAIGLIRGLEESALAGRHAVVANVDYRVPLWRIERGIGTWPFFARTVHASVFADIGHAWDTSFRTRDLSRSFGGELSLDVVVGYVLPVTFTAGMAWRDSMDSRGVVAFGRIGRAF